MTSRQSSLVSRQCITSSYHCRSLESIRNYATLTDVNIRPGSPGARRWSQHNSEYKMTSARCSEGLPNFHPFVSFLCICQKKTKIFLRQTLAEHIPWELITLGDVRNSSSLNTLSALVGNSFWDYVITGIVLGDPCHWYNAGSDTGLTYLVISGSPGMLWLCPRHGHCLRCLHCQLSSVSPLLLVLTLSPHSPGCHLLAVFTFYHFFWPYFVAGVSFFCDRTSDLFSCWHRSSVSALSTQKFSWLAPVWAPVSLF